MSNPRHIKPLYAAFMERTRSGQASMHLTIGMANSLKRHWGAQELAGRELGRSVTWATT
ncbi:hypothetical protein OAS55_02880 [Porticoccus sp.]|nr:hypothetical protein [Porticoccus sp.]